MNGPLKQCVTCLKLVMASGFYSNRLSCKRCVLDRKKIMMRSKDWTSYIYDLAKQRARRKGLKFSITERGIARVWRHQRGLCKLTGVKLEQTIDRENLNTGSLDQIVPGEGYTPENVQFVSVWANRSKSILDESDFQSRILQAAEFIRSQQETK